GVDVVVSASQKALMCPPGLGLASVSQKAWQIVNREDGLPRFYFDFRKYRSEIEEGATPYTSAVSLILGLNEALYMIHDEGIPEVLARHRRISSALRAGCAAIGLANFPTKGRVSNTVCVFRAPAGLVGNTIVRRLYEKHGTVIAGARNKLAGKVIRIGTMGDIREGDILTDLLYIEDVLAELGHKLRRGAGVNAASAVLDS
ncbi:MAG TPA: alanine--glyoxylate aminotransferase family protein, partial [Alphaproteobacteria bacterium]|nr:alanine--glyoxylate aminotransferase family protein [Alphaproteobacteria bacterium]